MVTLKHTTSICPLSVNVHITNVSRYCVWIRIGGSFTSSFKLSDVSDVNVFVICKVTVRDFFINWCYCFSERLRGKIQYTFHVETTQIWTFRWGNRFMLTSENTINMTSCTSDRSNCIMIEFTWFTGLHFTGMLRFTQFTIRFTILISWFKDLRQIIKIKCLLLLLLDKMLHVSLWNWNITL